MTSLPSVAPAIKTFSAIGAMPDYKVYKVYLIGDEGHSPERPEIITCTSDQEAASRAVELTARRSNAGQLFMRYLLLVSIRIH